MRRTTLLLLPLLLLATAASAGPRGKQRRAKPPAPVVVDDDELDDDEDGDDRGDRVAAADDVDDDDDDDDDRPAIRRRSRSRTRPSSGHHTEFYFRAGVAHVEPRLTSSGMQLEPVGIARLTTPMEPVQGGVATSPTNVATAIIGVAPAVLRGYVAFETLIGIPKKTQLRAYGDLADMSLAPTALDLVPTGVPPLGSELGEAMAVPLMLTAVVRSPALGPLRVYVGGGASVLLVKDAKVTNAVLTEVATPKLEISPALGVVAQGGIDVHLFGRVYARADYKIMWFEPAETRISNIHVRTTIPLLETVHVGSARSESTANPRILQIGIGANF